MSGRAAIALAALSCSCTIMEKKYAVDVVLPDGDAANSTSQGGDTIVMSVDGVEITIEAEGATLASWLGPLLLPPILPVGGEQWKPSNVSVVLAFQTWRSGGAFSPAMVRLRAGGKTLAQLLRQAEPDGEAQRIPDRAVDAPLVLAEGNRWLQLEFPIPSPLEDDAELDLCCISIEGRRVPLPPVRIKPRYFLRTTGVP